MLSNKIRNGWNKRKDDEIEKVDPYRKYCFICEGENTEKFYFEELINMQKELRINDLLELKFLDKKDEYKSASAPIKLIEYADKQMKSKSLNFDKNINKMVIVFDADVFEKKSIDYEKILNNAKEKIIY